MTVTMPGYPKGKYPSTGFRCYHFFKKYLNDDIRVVNFYGTKTKYYYWDGHGFDYESKFFDDNNCRIFI